MTALFITLLSAPVFGQSPEDEVRKYFVRGQAAAEMAKSEAGLANAVAEFKKAIEIAPNMAALWYNLALVQAKMGQTREAIGSYQKYLALAPQAEDAGKVRDEIVKLEYRQERADKRTQYLGLSAKDNSPSGLIISDVQQGSPAEEAGLMQNDIILQVNRTDMQTTSDFEREINRATSRGGGVMLQIKRDDVYFFVSLQKK